MRIGLVGLAGAGKDTAAQIISKHLRFPCVAFAEPIHEAAKYVFGDLYLERGVKELPLPFGNTGLNLTKNIAQSIINECNLDLSDEELQIALKVAFTNRETGKIYEELSPRKFMQLFGTEFGRNIDEKIWVNRIENKYSDCVISDVRFENEMEICNIIVVVERDGSGVEGYHVSENLAKRLKNHPNRESSFTITNGTFRVVGRRVDNNGTIDDLREKLKQIFS